MRNGYLRIWPALAAFAAINCGGGSGSSTGPGGGGGSGLTATIDGNAWAAAALTISAGAMAGIPGGILVLGSQNANGLVTSINITLQNVRGPGTYDLGVGPDVYGGTASVGEGTAGSGGNSNSWITPLNGVAGTVTITTLSGGRIVGSFQYTAVPGHNSTATGTRTVTNGQFDLPFTGTLTPVPANVGSKVSALHNGVPYNAWLVIGTLTDFTGGAGVNISTTSSENGVSLQLQGVTAPGTYTLTNIQPIRSMTAGLNGGIASNCCWGAAGVGNVGTITVTSLTAARVQGTFSATLPPSPGKPATAPLVITNGSFDVGIQ